MMFRKILFKILNTKVFPLRTLAISSNHDTILITGGSNGLGLALVKNFLAAGFKVIVLDIVKPPIDTYKYNNSITHRSNLIYVEFDLSDVNNFKNLPKYLSLHNIQKGEIKVIINNAGIINGKCLSEIKTEMIEKTILVNYESAILLILSLDEYMCKDPSTLIVSVASVLGLITPPKLTLYGASKKALIRFHSFLNELQLINSPLKSLLILPGQIDTGMFNGVKTPNNLLAPVLEADCLAQNIFSTIVNYEESLNETVWKTNMFNNKGKVYYAPFYVGLVPIFKNLPFSIVNNIRKFSGMDQAMNGYIPIGKTIKTNQKLIEL